MLQLKDVTISYKNEPTVEHFNLNMKQGQIVSLVGESGSGKTTVIRAILGLLAGGGKVSEGSVLFENQDLLSYTNEQWRKLRGTQISMIFQDSGAMMNPTRKVGKVFTEYILTHEKISKKEAYEKAVFLLKQVKIPSPEVRIQQYPHELSGGMQQRVMIAIALACNPKVLIADEPTTALDVTIQAQILSLLKELRDQLGIAVILITHNMGVVAAVCDRMLVMYGGAVVEEGKCTELFENPCHPYTRGLLAAIPSIKERKEKLYTIPGQVPKMKVPVQYCRFCSRCSYAQEVCHEKEPGMQGENGHLYKCFYTPQQQEKEKCGPGGGAL